MRISLLVAMDENRGIGINNGLPWRLSTDLKRFKSLTMGHHLIMGRKTYESIGKPLAGRRMIVVTRNPAYRADGCLIAHSVEEALGMAEVAGEREVFVIGGGEIFSQTIALADRLYLTMVHAHLVVDTFFPEIDESHWVQLEAKDYPTGERDQFPHSFRLLQKISSSWSVNAK
jgi:dihydrofolate reductase